MDRELTLRDYGRVLWSGRWLIVSTAIAAALVALVIGLVRTTTYSATSRVFLGQVTTVGGIPISTPDTTPSVAPDVLGSDDLVALVARRTGVSEDDIRDGVSFTVPRAPGAAAGNQPSVATIVYTDADRTQARDVVNAYAEEVLAAATQKVDVVQEVYVQRIAQRKAELTDLDAQVADARRGLRATASPQDRALWQTLLLSATQLQAQARLDLSNQELSLAKSKQAEEPRLVSRSDDSSSSAGVVARARTVVFGLIIGLVIGIVITFVWRGSPARRADP